MAYYVRVLGKANPTISINQLKESLIKEDITASIELNEGTKEHWTQLMIKDDQNRNFAVIEKNEVVPGQLGAEELDEFKEEILDYKPDSAVKWLTNFFEKVIVIYAFQVLDAIYEGDNWSTLDVIKTEIWARTAGILQADHEGFSNEDGYHILWQFNSDVSGPYDMAVKSIFGWTKFQMDLGDHKQREQFWNGKVPAGAKKI